MVYPLASRSGALSKVGRSRVAAICSFGIAWLITSTALAKLPTIQLTSVFPPGGKFGTCFDVTIIGDDIEELQQLFFSHPGITATSIMTTGNDAEKSQPVAEKFTVTIQSDVPPGTYEARVAGRYGMSNPRAFDVGVYDESVNACGNNARSSAMRAAIGSIINGRVDATNRNYFKLSLRKSQRVMIDFHAQRIDSRLNATLVLSDAKGKLLARSLDSIGSDPFLDFTAPAEGDYSLSLYDFVYQGGEDYFYRLAVHNGPHVDFIFPPPGVAGSSAQYTIYGRNLPGGQPADLSIEGFPIDRLSVEVAIPGDEAGHHLELASRVAPCGSMIDVFSYRLANANHAPLYYAKATVVAEVEGNNKPAASQTFAAPCEVMGQFYPAHDIDLVQFEAKKGEVYYIELFSHRLGIAVDPRFIVQRVTGDDKGEESVSEIANVDDPGERNSRIGGDFDTSTDDPSYKLTVDQDATYRITLRDQFGDKEPDSRAVYRLAIRRPDQPDFRLVAVSQLPAKGDVVLLGSSSIRKGGTTIIRVDTGGWTETLRPFEGGNDKTTKRAQIEAHGFHVGGSFTFCLSEWTDSQSNQPSQPLCISTRYTEAEKGEARDMRS